MMPESKFDKLNKLLDATKRFSNFVATGLPDAGTPVSAAPAPAEADPFAAAPPQQMEIPPLSGGELKPYQKLGVQWLCSLYTNGVNGLLADEMGLGKTIMTIAYFACMLQSKVSGPHLLVVPPSTLGNWTKEFAKWLPAARVTIYHGTQAERKSLRERLGWMGHEKLRRMAKPPAFFKDDCARGWGIYITTPQVAISDSSWLGKHKWQTLVVDEAHRLKNFQCQLIKRLRVLDTEHRILLTGTPLQNNLSELWSILNFLMPKVFDDLKAFTAWFDFDALHSGAGDGAGDAAHNQQQHQVVTKLHAILRPFMLRRCKNQLLDELPMPGKQEIVVFCNLTPAQRQQYNLILNQKLGDLVQERDSAAATSTTRTRTKVSSASANVVMQLQKLCNHPMLFPELDPFADKVVQEKVTEERWEFDGDGDRIYLGSQTRWRDKEVSSYDPELLSHRKQRLEHILSSCSKMQLLDKMLKRLREQGHKVLIFSQMTRMLDLIEELLESKRGWGRIFRIDGNVNTSERQGLIDEFNEDDEAFVFLLSTRAGGQGINLASADTVIIYDSDWNPQVDLQAQDRCHRIGQSSDVVVYRLVTRGTVESYILERATSKLRLENLVIAKGGFHSRRAPRLDPQELRSALQLAPPDAHLGDDAASNRELLERLLDRKQLAALIADRKRQADAEATPRAKRPKGGGLGAAPRSQPLLPVSPYVGPDSGFDVLPSMELP